MAVDIYSRLSRVEPDGTQTATVRQEKDCHAFAGIREWTIGEVHTDVDLSAYDRRIERPGYEQLLERVRSGEIQGILVWKLDRLVRRVAEFERLWAVCEEAGCFIASATEPIDTRTEIGILIVRILVAFAQMESATMSLRIRNEKRHFMLAGGALGKRPFGLTIDRKKVVDAEAELICEAAERVVAGDSLRSIVMDWNRAGIPTHSGTSWKAPTLRRILLGAAVVGDHTYKGQVAVEGAYPPILERETQAEVAAILGDPGRRTGSRDGSLLTGLLRCGACGAPMRHGYGTDRKGRYFCPSVPNGCNRNTVHSDVVDESVSARAVAHLQEGEFDPGETSQDFFSADLTSRLADLEGQIAELEQDYYVDRKVSRDGFERSRARLASEQERLEGQLARKRVRRVKLGDGADVIDEWERLTPERRKAALADLIVKVTVVPVGRGRRRGVDQLPILWR